MALQGLSAKKSRNGTIPSASPISLLGFGFTQPEIDEADRVLICPDDAIRITRDGILAPTSLIGELIQGGGTYAVSPNTDVSRLKMIAVSSDTNTTITTEK